VVEHDFRPALRRSVGSRLHEQHKTYASTTQPHEHVCSSATPRPHDTRLAAAAARRPRCGLLPHLCPRPPPPPPTTTMTSRSILALLRPALARLPRRPVPTPDGERNFFFTYDIP
jgi:hypothetical protein